MLAGQKNNGVHSTSRERLTQRVRRLAELRNAQNAHHAHRASERTKMTSKLTADPRFWRVAGPEHQGALLAQANLDRTHLGHPPLEQLPDPRMEMLAALFHRHCVEAQMGVPTDDHGEPQLDPFLEELEALFGEAYLAEQNVNLHNQLKLAKTANQDQSVALRNGKGQVPESSGPAETPEPGPASPGPRLLSWRENYRQLIAPYVVAQTSVEDRRERFYDLLTAWRNLHQAPKMRPELRRCFLQALLRESGALHLGWTERTLEAYAQRGAPAQGGDARGRTPREMAAPRGPFKMAYLGRAREHLAILLDRNASPEQQEAVGAELLTAVFDLDAATAQGLAGLPPGMQVRMLQKQAVLRAGDTAHKGAWERMIFARMLPRKLAGLAPDAWSGYVEATRALARGTWRYFRG